LEEIAAKKDKEIDLINSQIIEQMQSHPLKSDKDFFISPRIAQSQQ